MTTARHPNLENAFAPPSRGASLAGILPVRESSSATHPQPGPTAAAAAEIAAATKPRAGKRQSTTRTTTAGNRNVAAYLPPTTLRAAGEWIRIQDQSYADLLVKAFDDVDPEALRRAFLPRNVSTPTGMPRRTVVPRGATGIQRQFRLDEAQLTWLDQQVVDLGAPSRSALVAAAVGLFLGTHQA